jgi:hypothetical protein
MDEILENNTGQIRCEDELTLQKLLDEELHPDKNELVFHHLKGCQRCSALFQDLKEKKSFCQGRLGYEDELEADYSPLVLKRVRAQIGSTMLASPVNQPPRSSESVADLESRESQMALGRSGVQVHPEEQEQRTKESWFQSLRSRRQSFSIDWSFWLRPGMVTSVATVLLVVVGLALLLRDPSPVSAAELLRKSAAAEEAIAARADQVLRRVINLEEINPANGALIAGRKIEIWHSAENRLTARRSFDGKNHLVAGEWKKADGSRVIYQNGTRLQAAADRQPAAFLTSEQIWLLDPSAKDFASLVGNVEAARVEEKGGTYVISYNAESGRPRLVRATLVLSKADLHTIEQRLLVDVGSDSPQSAINRGPQEGSPAGVVDNSKFVEYRFTETNFERRAANTVAPAVFEPDPLLLAGGEKKADKTEVKMVATPSLLLPSVAPGASAELEVEVLEKLNRANAFLGEQLSLTRTSEGTLLVSGIVETSERKSEILRSLGDVAKNPAVKVDVNTVAEAQRRQKPGNPGAISIQDVQVAQNTVPVDAELRAYLSRSRGLTGQQLEQEIEQLSQRVLLHSTRARSHALALKQIAERFSPADIEAMDPSARTRWRVLINQHAQFFRREVEQLRQELGPIFPGSSAAGGGGEVEIANDQDLARAAKRLFELASVTDNGLRRSFSLSSERVSDAPVKSQQFWRSFGSAEAIAAKIAGS